MENIVTENTVKKEKRTCPLCDKSFIAKIEITEDGQQYDCLWCKQVIIEKKKKKGVYFVNQ